MLKYFTWKSWGRGKSSKLKAVGNKLRFLLKHADSFVFILFFALVGYIFFFMPWVAGDGVSYFAYLRSLVVDGDLNFLNEFSEMSGWGVGRVFVEKTRTGYYGNANAIGPAILWSPFYLASYLSHNRLFSEDDSAGYSKADVYAVSFATLFYSLAGLILTYLLIAEFYSKKIALYSTLFIWYSTPLAFYMYRAPSMSHGLSFFAVTLFIYVWHKKRGAEKSFFEYAYLGALAAVMSLIRWQDMLFASIIFLESASLALKYVSKKHARKLKVLMLKNTVFAFVLFVGFTPQLMVWKILYGGYFNIPYGSNVFNWLKPKTLDVIFSTKHGLFTWNPVYVLASIGLFPLYKKMRQTLGYLIAALILQLYFIGVFSSWHGDWSFGMRFMVNSTLIFALGLAALLNETKNKKYFPAVILTLLLFVIWNTLLIIQHNFNHAVISPQTPFREIVRKQFTDAPALTLKFIKERIY